MAHSRLRGCARISSLAADKEINMAYGKYKSIHEVSKKYQVAIAAQSFIEFLPFPTDERFQAELPA